MDKLVERLNSQRNVPNFMQTIRVELARSIWLFDITDLNPAGKSLFPDMLLWLGEKYSFDTFPKSIADLDKEKKGYLFKTGEFQTDDGAIQVNLSIYGDGIVAENWGSTEKGDMFIDDVLRSVSGKYGLVFKPSMIRTKQYISEIIVELDHQLNGMNPKIAKFCETLSSIFSRHHLGPFEMTGMLFAPDVLATSYKPPGLTIERKQGAPFSANRFWSKSPFTTKEHLFALEEFEKMLTVESSNIEVRPTQHDRQVRLTD
jgi:hypothetical protein